MCFFCACLQLSLMRLTVSFLWEYYLHLVFFYGLSFFSFDIIGSYKIIIILLLRVFHISVSWSLSNCKSPQVTKTVLSIPSDLKNAVVSMVSISPHISNSSSPFFKTSGTVLSLLLINPRSGLLAGIINLFVSQNSRELSAFHYPRRILVCNNIWQYSQISNSCTNSSGIPKPVVSRLTLPLH